MERYPVTYTPWIISVRNLRALDFLSRGSTVDTPAPLYRLINTQTARSYECIETPTIDTGMLKPEASTCTYRYGLHVPYKRKRNLILGAEQQESLSRREWHDILPVELRVVSRGGARTLRPRLRT